MEDKGDIDIWTIYCIFAMHTSVLCVDMLTIIKFLSRSVIVLFYVYIFMSENYFVVIKKHDKSA